MYHINMLKPCYKRTSKKDSEEILANLQVAASVQTTNGICKETENDVSLSDDLSTDKTDCKLVH